MLIISRFQISLGPWPLQVSVPELGFHSSLVSNQGTTTDWGETMLKAS